MAQRASVLAVLLVCAGSAAPGAAHAAPTWLGPTTLSPTGADATRVDLAMGPGGDTLAAWVRGTTVETSFRPAGGTFGPVVPVPLLEGAVSAGQPSVAFDGSTAIVATVQSLSGGGPAGAAAARGADGSFGPAIRLTSPGRSSGTALLTHNAAGEVLALWEEVDGPTREMGMSVRPSGGQFGPAARFSSGGGASGYDGFLDPQGNALVAWASGTSIHVASRPAGGPFTFGAPVVTTPDALSSPSVAVGPAGQAVVVYLRFDSGAGKQRPWATVRPAASTIFGPPQDVSPNDLSAIFIGAAVSPSGEAIALVQAGTQPWARVAPPGGVFGAATRLSPASHDMYAPQIATSGDGTTHVLWPGNGADGYHVRHVRRRAGGEFEPMQTLPGGPVVDLYPRLGVDAQGNAAAVWLRREGTDDRVQVSGYDGAPPQLRSLSFSRSGHVGTVLPFSAEAVDVWSPVSSIGWEFGDGATASGAGVSHAYGAPGTYGASVTATDALGNAGIATGTVTIVPAPVPVPGRPPGSTDRVAPALSGLELSPVRFRAASRGATLAATATGTTVRYTLSEAASARFTAERAVPGRRVGGSCRRVTARNRRRARCTRFVAVQGSADRRSVRGANRVRFRGRLGGRRLAPGRYRLLSRATDGAGNRSALRRVALRIVAR